MLCSYSHRHLQIVFVEFKLENDISFCPFKTAREWIAAGKNCFDAHTRDHNTLAQSPG